MSVDAAHAGTNPPPPGLALQQALLRRALAARDAASLHLRFRAAVVQRYRDGGAQVLRTRSVGRIALAGRWSLDVGIAAEGAEVHLPVRDLLERLPEGEWPRWIAHLVEVPASEAFLRMRRAANACIDDGDAQPWGA